MLNLIGIKTSNNQYYITDNIDNKSYFTSNIPNYYFNGEKLKQSFKPGWFVLPNDLVTVKMEQAEQYINKRWNLIDVSLSDKFQREYSHSDVYDYNSDEYVKEFNSIIGLYKFNYDIIKSELIDVQYNLHIILNIEEIKEPSSFSYKCLDSTPITNSNIKYDLISQIINPSILLHTQPCKLSHKQTYDIIRAYIKDNINYNVAKITSDFDFCFTVEKIINLAKPYEYTKDVSTGRHKPKYKTILQSTRQVKLFEMCHKSYQSYPVIEPFAGDNDDDLKNNIDSYLSELISIINEPICECEYCNGTGVKLINVKK